MRILNLTTFDLEKIPGAGANNICAVWLDGTIFFLSDRDLAMNVWAYDTVSKAVTQLTHFKEFDCKNLSGTAGTLVFENGGYLYTLVPGGEPVKLSVTLRGDFPWARPHWVATKDAVRNGTISPTGKRAIFEARGDIYTVPAEKGDIRNLTNSSGTAERTPSWSPDGKTVAWFSDESGVYQLVLADQTGADRRVIKLENPDFFYTPVWSPDSKHLAFTDAGRVLWLCEVDSGKVTEVDCEGFAHPQRNIYPAWAPDSRWIAYSRLLPNQFNAVFVYGLDDGKSVQVTDGLSNAHSPAWERGGKYLAFLASTNYGMNVGWLDMSSYERPLDYSIYLAVLAADTPSPLAPESDDEEAVAEDKDDEGDKEDKEDKDGEEDEEEADVDVKIDFAGLSARIIALAVPARPYGDLQPGGEGIFFYTETVENTPGASLHRYDLAERESKKVTDGVRGYQVSADGEKLLLRQESGYAIVDAAGEPAPGDGALDLGAMKMYLDPAAEWQQIFAEAVRFQRDFFYVKNVHGLDLDWAAKAYGPWVAHVRHRDDLNYVLDILGGETSIGHSFTRGGDHPKVNAVNVGLLGCDLAVKDDRFFFATIYTGESWNPELRAPLSGPGLDITEGDFLLAVDGVDLTADINPFSLFENTAEKQVVLTLSSQSDGKDSRQVTVVPVARDSQLRRYHWVEGNRRRVDELSGGQLAYIWVPDTGGGGYANFNRYYFAQQDKKGAILDERFNHGGSIADHMVDLMARKLLGYFNNPVGDKQPFTAPNAAIWGPKVLIINEMAGSGGDMLPYMFHKMKIGPMVGTRTWGGLVGIWDVPRLVDGGGITAPRGGFYDTDGNWAVENEGVSPDIEVEMDPKLVNAGHDPQLEAAVQAALDLMATEGVELLPQPADPVRVGRPE
ncbi:MAG: protease [Deltaproteobacteria bacterium]|nr:MAG: protease [Deltaproteobacteria bacterium]